VAGIDLHLAQLLVDAGRFSEASTRVWRAIKSTSLAWPVYAELAAVWADVTIASGKLQEADAWLQSIQAEAIVRGIAVPASVHESCVRLDFWRGSPASAITACASSNSTEALGWLALSAWRDGDRTALERFARSIDGRATDTDLTARFWSVLFRGLVRCASVDAGQLITLAGDLKLRQQLLARAIAGRIWLEAGDRERALKVLGSSDGDEPERRLIRLLRRQAEVTGS